MKPASCTSMTDGPRRFSTALAQVLVANFIRTQEFSVPADAVELLRRQIMETLKRRSGDHRAGGCLVILFAKGPSGA